MALFLSWFINTFLALGLQQDDGTLITPITLVHRLHPLEADRGISAETCGLEGMFPCDDLDFGSGPYTQSIIICHVS